MKKRKFSPIVLIASGFALVAVARAQNVAPAPPAPKAPKAPAAAPVPPLPPAAVGLPPLPPIPPLTMSGNPKSLTLSVKGPILLRANLGTTDVEIVPGSANEVKVELGDCERDDISLVDHGDRVDLSVPFQAGGDLRVILPPSSSVELSSVSGDLNVHDLGGKVRVRATTGDVRVRGASSVEATLVSGDVNVEACRGEVRLRTVSGDARVVQEGGPATQLEFGSTSGDLAWRGACGAGCRIEARTTSGDLHLTPAAGSSFELAFLTHSGDFDDTWKLTPVASSKRGGTRGKLGKGEGTVECQTFSGDLALLH